MANVSTGKKRIAILTGGGDVPGLNPAIRAVTIRALREGWEVIGLRRGWAGAIDIVREHDHDNSDNFQCLTEEIVNRAGRTGGTFLHTSRTRPSSVKADAVPEHLKAQYNQPMNDLTPEILKNLDWLGVDNLIPIGGDDTLSYAMRMHKEGVKVIAIPKTMDNDVPGTDYCIGFSTCVTRTIEMAHRLRTSAGSHERLLVNGHLGDAKEMHIFEKRSEGRFGCVGVRKMPEPGLGDNRWHAMAAILRDCSAILVSDAGSNRPSVNTRG